MLSSLATNTPSCLEIYRLVNFPPQYAFFFYLVMHANMSVDSSNALRFGVCFLVLHRSPTAK